MIDLSIVDSKKVNAIVIRHADRDPMEHGQINQPLNDIGRQNAQHLGEKMHGFTNYLFFSSPVDRCQETIEYIQKGIFQNNEKKDVTLSNTLGEPGPFVVNKKDNAFHIYGCQTVVEKQIAHENLLGIRNTTEGAKILVNYVRKQTQLAKNGTLLVFVTHDAIIGPTIFELTNERFNHSHWPDFADGFILERYNNKERIIRNNTYFDLKKL